MADERAMPPAESQLSAMIDGELTPFETQFAVQRLLQNTEARRCWERYHLISDVLQDHLPITIDTGFAARIQQAIAAEPPQKVLATPWRMRHKPTIRWALAASVVIVGWLGLQLNQFATPEPSQSSAIAIAPPAASPLTSPSAPSAPMQVASASRGIDTTRAHIEASLNSYLVNHSGRASMHNMPGMLPYVRLVGYQTDLER